MTNYEYVQGMCLKMVYDKLDIFLPDDLWLGLYAYTSCALMHDLYLHVWLMGCAICIYMSNWWGKG